MSKFNIQVICENVYFVKVHKQKDKLKEFGFLSQALRLEHHPLVELLKDIQYVTDQTDVLFFYGVTCQTSWEPVNCWRPQMDLSNLDLVSVQGSN